jgi:hypothetical protein
MKRLIVLPWEGAAVNAFVDAAAARQLGPAQMDEIAQRATRWAVLHAYPAVTPGNVRTAVKDWETDTSLRRTSVLLERLVHA